LGGWRGREQGSRPARAPAVPDLAHLVTRGAFWAAVESATQQLLQFLVFVLLARLLGPEAWGLVGAALIVTAIGQTLVNEGGWAEALIQRRQIDHRHRDSVLWLLLGTTSLLVMAAWLLRAPAARLLGTPEVARILPWLALALPLNALGVVPRALLRRELRLRPLALRPLFALGVAGAVAIALAWRGFGFWSLVAFQLVQPFVEAMVLWAAAGWRPRLAVSGQALGEIVGYVSGVFGERLLVLVDALLPRVVITLMLGPVALGLYTFARKLFDVTVSLLVGPLTRVALPAFAALQGDPARTQRALTLGVELSSLLAVPAFLGLALTAADLVPLVFGAAWVAAVPAVQILALAGIAAPLTRLSGAFLLGRGRSRAQFALALAGTALLALLLLVLLTASRTVEAVVLAIGLRYGLMLPLRLHWLGRHGRIALAPMLAGLAPVLGSAAVMALALLLLRSQLPAAASPAARLALSVLVGGCAYLAALLVGGRPLLRRAARLARLSHPTPHPAAAPPPDPTPAPERATPEPLRETT
jgi:O-antigen/teichoic acid export membrane protein